MKMTLRAIRTNFGLTQGEAAQLIGVSESTWFNYEQCKSSPNQKYLEKIQKVFGISYDDIIFQTHLRLNRKKAI